MTLLVLTADPSAGRSNTAFNQHIQTSIRLLVLLRFSCDFGVHFGKIHSLYYRARFPFYIEKNVGLFSLFNLLEL